MDQICETCAVALVNADTSHMDDETIELLDKYSERRGIVAHAYTEHEVRGYWECDACDEVSLGPVNYFEQVG